MKVIALDYDDTYTADPQLWDEFVRSAQRRGHLVVCVTFRPPSQPCKILDLEVFYTSGQPKAAFMAEAGPFPDIWIDDLPHIIGKAPW